MQKNRYILPMVQKRSSKNSYVNNIVEEINEGEDKTEDNDATRGHVCSNSTKNIIMPYSRVVFSDVHLRDYVCIQVNLPSGICDKLHGLQDKVQATV
jgi:hypothetical protein